MADDTETRGALRRRDTPAPEKPAAVRRQFYLPAKVDRMLDDLAAGDRRSRSAMLAKLIADAHAHLPEGS